MSASADGKAKGKRKSRIPAGPAGARLVMDELLRRGFDAHLADCCAKKYDVLVGQCGSPPKPVHVSTVHVSPWYVRSSNFVGAAANEVTVHVLPGLKTSPNCASFPRTEIWRPSFVSRRIGAISDSSIANQWSDTKTTGDLLKS